GRIHREEAIAETARATRRYARRQESWLRPDERVVWLEAGAAGPVEAATAHARRPPRHLPPEWTPWTSASPRGTARRTTSSSCRTSTPRSTSLRSRWRCSPTARRESVVTA